MTATTRNCGESPDSNATLKIKIAKCRPDKSPDDALPELASGEVSGQESIENEGLKGATDWQALAGFKSA